MIAHENDWVYLDHTVSEIPYIYDTEKLVIKKDLFYKTLSTEAIEVSNIIIKSFIEYGMALQLTEIRKSLRKMGWKHKTIRKSFQEIRTYLHNTKEGI